MEHGQTIPYLREVVLFLAVAAILIPIFRKARISPIFGYLLAGLAIGPYGLGRWTDEIGVLRYVVIDDVDGVATLANLGVVFLLFLIGLELSIERLLAMRRMVFGFGGSQVVVTGAVVAAVALGWNGIGPSIVLGLCLALSSTAIVVQTLVEQGRIAAPVGRAGFAVLLFQDLMVAPILVIVAVLAAPGTGGMAVGFGIALAKIVAAGALILLLGRFVLRPLFRLVASARSPDLFTALVLLIIIGISAAAEIAGLSMALGAFLAGVVLAETEYRHQIEVDVEPFKGLLLGLFFLSVGMGIDLVLVWDAAAWVIPSAIGLYAIKTGLATGLAYLFGQPLPVAIHVGLLLGQAGEFAFVVVGAAMATGYLAPDVGQFMIVVTGLTMMMTPPVAALAPRIALFVERRQMNARHGPPASDAATDLSGHAIIAGFGRVGQTVAHVLDGQMIPYVALDLDGAAVAQRRAAGAPVYYGDASRPEVLARVGAARAAILVITLDDTARAARTVKTALAAWPHLQIHVRARDTTQAEILRALGAVHVVPETVESSLQLAAASLSALGIPPETVAQRIEQIRAGGYENL